MDAHNHHFLAEAYSEFREKVTHPHNRDTGEPVAVPERELPPELLVQYMWHTGLLGREGKTERHGCVRVLDFGIWNREAGPDFRHCEIELNGQRLCGDIEIDPVARDWERHGHGDNKLYNNVVLHIILEKSPLGWYTRNALHYEVPILSLPPERVRQALGKTVSPTPETVELCRCPLADMPWEKLDRLLRAGAAFRLAKKRANFRQRAQCCGVNQTWYECWAETLGYRPNKLAMQLLAYRAPLDKLRDKAESILFGTAGFLKPLLPEKADGEAREYHRHVWDAWWPFRDTFELSHDRALPWVFSPIRPANHPHRRVAALAICASRWKEVEINLSLENTSALIALLTSMRHPYWDVHCSLTSAPMKRRVALVGEDRVQDFIVNHLYAQDERPAAWESYIRLKNGQIPGIIDRIAGHLFGEREDIRSRLRLYYVQQALLQINGDFCPSDPRAEYLFPARLAAWCK